MALELAVPLVPRRRVAGPGYGSLRSARRGRGGEVIGARLYHPGDDVRRIDQRASARLSFALDRDEFVVREHLAEEATRVVVVRDPRPSMSLFPPELPWLAKPEACRAAERVLAASARTARCAFRSSSDTIGHALEELSLGPRGRGSFVFLFSDFLELPLDEAWREPLERGWDLVPVVLQDPLWEQTFPDVAGVVLPILDPGPRRLRPTYLTRRECAERRGANEERFRAIVEQFDRLGLDPVLLTRCDDESVHQTFHRWAEARRFGDRVRP